MKKLLLICCLALSQSAYAANLSQVYVIGEKIDACGLSKDSVTAAIVGTMRYNRVNVSQNNLGVFVYHQVTAMDINGGCAVNVLIQFKDYANVYIKSLNKTIFSDILLCGNGSILTGPKHNIQARVNDEAKDIAQQCLMKISQQ